jgi:hypothetical protein
MANREGGGKERDYIGWLAKFVFLGALALVGVEALEHAL